MGMELTSTMTNGMINVIKKSKLTSESSSDDSTLYGVLFANDLFKRENEIKNTAPPKNNTAFVMNKIDSGIFSEIRFITLLEVQLIFAVIRININVCSGNKDDVMRPIFHN